MRSLTLVAISLALLLVPVAAAQLPAPPTPIYRVDVLNAPAAFTGLATTNATSTVAAQVVLTIGNVVCANAVSIPVAITATAPGAPAFFSIVLEPDVINITIDQGPHGAPPAGTFGGGSGDVVVRATITGNITANATIPIEITATAPPPPAPPTGCQGAGAISGASSTPVTVFANLTAEELPPEPPTPDADSPGFGLVAAIAAVAGVALLSRKRRAL